MRKFALSYYTGMFLLSLLISIVLLHYLFPINNPREVVLFAAIIVLWALCLFAIFAAWRTKG